MNPYSTALFFSALVGASVGVFALIRRKRDAPSSAFPLLMFACTWWSFTYAMEVAAPNPQDMLLWLRLQYPGIVAAPVLWLIFSAQFAGKSNRFGRLFLAGLFVLPLISIVLVWTNELHHLYFRNIHIEQAGPFPSQIKTPGPGYWTQLSYSYACLAGGILLIASSWSRSNLIYRRQAVILLVGASIPFVSNLLFVAGIRPLGHLNITPFAFTATGLVVAFGLFHYKLFDLLPLARNILLENLKDGIIVVDAEKRIVEMNPAAMDILGIKDEPPLGQYVSNILEGHPSLYPLFDSGRETRTEAVIRPEPLLVMDARLSPLADRDGSGIGALLVLRDITAEKRAEGELRKSSERLEVLLHSLPQAVLVIEAGTRRILDVNPQACLLIGLPSERIAGQTCSAFISTEKECACPLAEEGRSLDRIQCALINADGEKIPILKTALLVEVEGNRWIIECLSDISDLMRAEAERVEKERLQALVETAGAVCHEMNQPLMAVSAYGELCLMELDNGHPAFEKIRKIVEQAGRMAEITRKLATVTSYRTRGYLDGKILDIDSAAHGGNDHEPGKSF